MATILDYSGFSQYAIYHLPHAVYHPSKFGGSRVGSSLDPKAQRKFEIILNNKESHQKQ